MPIFTGTRFHNPGFVGLGHQALAHDFHFEDEWLDVPRQHNVAPPTQDTMAFWVVFQVLLDSQSVFFGVNSHQGIGLGHNAKAVVRLKGYVSGHVHGRIVAFSYLIIESHAIF
jgi:hypothetical protein